MQTKATQQRILPTNFWAVTALKFYQTLALDFPHICLQFFPGIFSRLGEKFLQTNVWKILISAGADPGFF